MLIIALLARWLLDRDLCGNDPRRFVIQVSRARQMFSLLKPGSGILIMIFPAEPYMIGETNSKRGAPPYQVPVGSIRAIAQQLDLKILKLERVEPKFSFRARQGLEWVCILQRHQRL